MFGNVDEGNIFPSPRRVAVADQALGLQILMADNQRINSLGMIHLIEHCGGQTGRCDIIVAGSVDVGLSNASLVDVDPAGNKHQQVAVSR